MHRPEEIGISKRSVGGYVVYLMIWIALAAVVEVEVEAVEQ